MLNRLTSTRRLKFLYKVFIFPNKCNSSFAVVGQSGDFMTYVEADYI